MVTRGIIYFEHTKLQKMYEDKTYPSLEKMHHILKMTNTASLTPNTIHKQCINSYYDDIKKRATSFDLIFFLINKNWDCRKRSDIHPKWVF